LLAYRVGWLTDDDETLSLSWLRQMEAPVYGLVYGDLRQDGVRQLTVVTSESVRVMQVDINVVPLDLQQHELNQVIRRAVAGLATLHS